MEICEFVSFSIAKKLKEKGFIGNVDIGQYGGYYYHDGEDIDVCYDCVDNADIAANEYLRPTISQVLKWLREEKKLHIELWVTGKRPIKWHNTIHTLNHTGECKGWSSKEESKSYEQAALAGIEYTLDNLIIT